MISEKEGKMPLLTDRQEPEDYNRPENPDDPNDYAIRYLFNPNRPSVEFERTGRVLFYSSAAANLLALGMYAAWLEFKFNPWLLVVALLITVSGGAAAYYLSRLRSLAYLLAVIPGLLTAGSLLYLFLNPIDDQAAYFTFFLPPSLVLAGSVILLRLAKKASI
jgi:hypothetical protein